jgi:hypothetical protein
MNIGCGVDVFASYVGEEEFLFARPPNCGTLGATIAARVLLLTSTEVPVGSKPLLGGSGCVTVKGS